jgi:hypothetical protein
MTDSGSQPRSPFCSHCGRPLSADAQFCSDCGTARGGNRPAGSQVLPANTRRFSLYEVGQEQTGNTLVDFLMFRRMIIPMLIRVVFVVSLLVCVIGFLVSLAAGNVGAALLFLFIGPLVARLFCELFILLFVMNDTFSDMRRILTELREIVRIQAA